MKTLSVISLLVCFASPAFAAESVTLYSCSAQKTVGWEKRKDGSNMIGQFKPNTNAFMIRYLPADTSHQMPKVPSIERPTPGGGTMHLTSDICDMSFRWDGEGPLPGIDWAMLCTGAVERGVQEPRKESFGEGQIRFSKSLTARPSFVSYVEVLVSPGGNSYLTEGQCELAN